MNAEEASINAMNISMALENVPEVQGSCQWMKSNPEKFASVVQTYINLIGRLGDYAEEDIKLTEKANRLMRKRNVRNTSASSLRANVFLKSLDNRQRRRLKDIAIQAFNPKSPLYQRALLQLANMMYEGHKMFASGETPRDGDPASDKVIWGHTQARKDVDPIILAHFIISHYLARFFAHVFDNTKITKNKDAFLAVLTDVVLLAEARKPGSTGVLDVWLTPRAKGGLGWLVQEQVNAYHDVVLGNVDWSKKF